MTPGQLDPVVGFLELVREFCAFIETAAQVDARERILRARVQVAELVHAACRLPSGDADGPDVDQEVSTPTDWPDVYHEVFDPYVDEPPVCGSLSDDLLDIYRDLKRGLVAYDAGQVGAAVWEWRFHFDHHWGDHAVDALRYLADRANIELTPWKPDAAAAPRSTAGHTRVDLLAVNAFALDFFRLLLKHPEQGAAGRREIEKRGFTPETAERFQIGLAADAWDALVATAAGPATPPAP